MGLLIAAVVVAMIYGAGRVAAPGVVQAVMDKITSQLAAAGSGGSASGAAVGDPDAVYAPSTSTASLRVAPKGSKSGYARDRFGQPWTDDATGVKFAHNGCDTRNDILRRDMTDVRVRTNNCTVLSGTLQDPYTGRTIHFVRGKGTSAKVQIDHVVALGNVWESGGAAWDLKKRMMIANDPLNLLAADGPANGSKQDKTADEWMPPNPGFQCRYIQRQVEVKTKYDLSVTRAEKATMDRILSRC